MKKALKPGVFIDSSRFPHKMKNSARSCVKNEKSRRKILIKNRAAPNLQKFWEFCRLMSSLIFRQNSRFFTIPLSQPCFAFSTVILPFTLLGIFCSFLSVRDCQFDACVLFGICAENTYLSFSFSSSFLSGLPQPSRFRGRIEAIRI